MDILTTVFAIIILIISVMFHELAHGSMADFLGDPTARLAGRLTLNPLLTWSSSVHSLLPLLCILSGTGFIIGWAKPIPFNERHLKYPRWGPALVAFAGPLVNIVLALLVAGAYRLLGAYGVNAEAVSLLAVVAMINVSLAIFNLVPVPPLDGHHILGAVFPQYKRWSNNLMQRYGFVILIAVIFFAGSLIGPVVSSVNRFLLL